jgi:hypothetical protein
MVNILIPFGWITQDIFADLFQFVFHMSNVVGIREKHLESLIDIHNDLDFRAFPVFPPFTERVRENRVSNMINNEFIFPDGSKGWFNLCIIPVQIKSEISVMIHEWVHSHYAGQN